jgi:hypothetical protein
MADRTSKKSRLDGRTKMANQNEKRQALTEARKYVEEAMRKLYQERLYQAATEERKAEYRQEYDRVFAMVGCIFADTARAFADEARAAQAYK